jgi:hypothetical protein
MASLSLQSRPRRVDVDMQRVVYVLSETLDHSMMIVGGKVFLAGTTATTVYDAASGDILAMRLDGPTSP